MITEKTLQLKDFFKNDLKLKEIHIDIYQNNPLAASSSPFMLLLRATENNAVVSNDGNRLILMKNDCFGTYFMDILFSEIKECQCIFSHYNHYEFILNIQNIWYRITVFN